MLASKTPRVLGMMDWSYAPVSSPRDPGVFACMKEGGNPLLQTTSPIFYIILIIRSLRLIINIILILGWCLEEGC